MISNSNPNARGEAECKGGGGGGGREEGGSELTISENRVRSNICFYSAHNVAG